MSYTTDGGKQVAQERKQLNSHEPDPTLRNIYRDQYSALHNWQISVMD